MIKISSKESIKRKLLSELLDRTEPVTVAELARLINKTGRTVRNYLNDIESDYDQYDLKVIRKPNVGIYLDISNSNRIRLKSILQEVRSTKVEEESFSSKYRRIYILKTLFEDKFSYTIQMFADELYCSKSTIVNDLQYVEVWLQNYNLTLKRRQNQGLWIEGKESDYRNALKELLNEIQEKEEDSEDENEDEKIDTLDYRIDFSNYKKIKAVFPKIDLIFIQNVIQESEKKLGFYFTDQAFLNLITHIAIAIERIKDKKSVSLNANHLESLKSENEYNIAKWMVNELSKKFKVTFPEEEIGYISMHILGAKVQGNYAANEYKDLLEKYDKDYVYIAKSIISMSSEILNIDLTEDIGLLTRLVLHLRPTIMRLRYGLKLKNPMLSRIKEEYTSIFGAAWACSTIFEKRLGVAINEDEVGYIALHLALSVQNIERKLKTVIVCSSGIGTSQLVASKLRKKFPDLEITQILPFNLLSNSIIQKSDLIITTIKNVKYNEKVIYVSTLLSDKDLMNIEDTIKRLKNPMISNINEKQDDEKVENKLDGILNKNLCFLNSEITDFAEAITYYGGLLEKLKYAKKGFCENIMAREKKGSTYVGKGIAIPHASDKYVNESKVCIVRFNNPIAWQGNQLDFIVILCLKIDDISITKKFFKIFYSILENDELISRIKKAENIDSMISILSRGGYRNE